MASRPLNPVLWTEGMFLRPQHLQQWDVSLDERLRYHLSGLDPFRWGLRRLEINEEALSDNRVEVMQLDAVLPGGAILRYPDGVRIETREFDGSRERIDVHVALRRPSQSAPNVASEGSTRDVRYFQQSRDLPDWNQGGNPVPVELAVPNLRLFLSGEERELEVHESFKLAEIVATGEIKRPFALDPGYCPPLLSLQAHPPLLDKINRTVAQIAAKVRVVAGRTGGAAVGDLPRMWMRYTLARMTPVLRHLLSTGETRPFDLYTALAETAGALAAFQLEEPAELPVYDHARLGACFGGLLDFLDEQLQEAVPERFTELSLGYDPTAKMYVTEELNTDLVSPRNLYYLGVKADLEDEDLARRVQEEGKAGSRGSARVAVMTKTEGLKIERLPQPPTEIAARQGFLYFRIDPKSPKWAKVKDDFTFALSIPNLESADARLYVVTGAS